jgi:hypothetical protein
MEKLIFSLFFLIKKSMVAEITATGSPVACSAGSYVVRKIYGTVV